MECAAPQRRDTQRSVYLGTFLVPLEVFVFHMMKLIWAFSLLYEAVVALFSQRHYDDIGESIDNASKNTDVRAAL